jgi:hypothetical protein
MIVMKRGNDVRADPRVGQRPGDHGGKADGVEARMCAEADPRPFAGRIGADDGQPLLLAEQRELVRPEGRIGGWRETVALRIEPWT